MKTNQDIPPAAFEEHPEARRWRLQLCEEQGRRFKLERENKGLRGALASTRGCPDLQEGAGQKPIHLGLS